MQGHIQGHACSFSPLYSFIQAGKEKADETGSHFDDIIGWLVQHSDNNLHASAHLML